MKGRESGMPEEDSWSTFFDAPAAVRAFECAPAGTEAVAEFGCGFGTFTLPVARATSGPVIAWDIEADMVALVARKAKALNLPNIRVERRDFVTAGTGLPDAAVDHAMVYNLLHLEEPVALLREARRILRPGGRVSIMHWKFDPSTPRGPPLAIRPKPEQCRAWGDAAGLRFVRAVDLPGCPHHYGLLLERE